MALRNIYDYILLKDECCFVRKWSMLKSVTPLRRWRGGVARKRESARRIALSDRRERVWARATVTASLTDWRLRRLKTQRTGQIKTIEKKTRSRKEENKHFSKEWCRLPRLRYVALNTSSYKLLVTNGQSEIAYVHLFSVHLKSDSNWNELEICYLYTL